MISRRARFFVVALSVLPVFLLAQSSDTPTPPPARQASEAPAQAPPPGKPLASFKVGIDVVSLSISVVDAGGHYVTDLDKPDFHVFEDGVQQDVTFFTRENLPVALAILIDTSASMDERMQTAQDAAIGFVKTLRVQDLGELVDFDSRVEVLQPFTNDQSKLDTAIRRTTAGGSTSLNNAIYISLKDLRKQRLSHPEDVRRQAIVLVSDGEDTSSLVTPDEVLDLAKRSEVTIYPIGIRSKGGLTTRGFHEAEYFLRALAQETGGRAFFPERIEDLASVYSQIADELSSQYSVGYSPKNPKRDGSWRTVIVRVDRPNVTPRAKRGYYAPVSSTHD